jgi:hypothetical protein
MEKVKITYKYGLKFPKNISKEIESIIEEIYQLGTNRIKLDAITVNFENYWISIFFSNQYYISYSTIRKEFILDGNITITTLQLLKLEKSFLPAIQYLNDKLLLYKNKEEFNKRIREISTDNNDNNWFEKFESIHQDFINKPYIWFENKEKESLFNTLISNSEN